MREYFPNACLICSATKILKRCSRCQMISYCGPVHQKEHWPEHKKLCKIIATMMQERGVTHLFEKLRGVDMLTWRKERMLMSYEAEGRLCERFEMNDRYMFKFPRACFVCHESRQDLLTNCPGCPATSFCKEHPSSPVHDEDCPKLRECFENGLRSDTFDPTMLQIAISATMVATRPPKPSNQPAALKEYLFEYTKSALHISDDMRVYISDIFSITLTVYSALQKLDYPAVAELTIHAGHVEIPIEVSVHWETLLHLLPDLKVLKVLIFDYSYDIDYFDREIKVCPYCRKNGKKLTVDFRVDPYAVYMRRANYKQPDLLVYSNLTVPEKDDCALNLKASTNLLKAWPRLKCPLIITSFTENDSKMLKKTMHSILGDIDLCFDGFNPFKPLLWFRTYEDGRVGSSNHNMIIIKPKHTQSKLSSDPFLSEVNMAQLREKLSRNYFYASVCHVCRSANTSVTCNRCKMIFYCGKAHQSEDQSQHKDLCKVILRMLNESGTSNLFDELKTTDSELWLRAKIDFMMKAKSELGRKLLDYEKQMFLYPKTCFACHESDLSLLKNCGCGVSLCKTHKEDPRHKELCKDLSLALKLIISEQPRVSKTNIKALTNKEKRNLPSSMLAFIDSNLNLKKEVLQRHVPNSQEILISDFLTGPLTLLWAQQKLNCKVDSSMVVHVVGATSSEIFAQQYWKIILYYLKSLKTLTLVFIHPEIVELKPSDLESQLEFPKSALAGKTLKLESHTLKYEEYFQSDSFIQPNIIVGFNLHIHESELGISDCNWKEMLMTLKKVNAPFILTAGSEERAQKDHEKFCEYLGKDVNYVFCDRNPFSGLIPERDFKTEGLMYSNQFVILYNSLYEK